jgi:hypothetical protein
MTHISRPLQIGLVAMALFVAVWFVVLRGHSTSSEGSGSSAPSSAPSSGGQPAAPAKASGSGGAASPGSVYHGSAPGVAGLTRAITKAQGAVAQSQQNAKQLQERSAHASSSTQTQNAQAQNSTQAQSSAGSQAGSTTTKASPGHAPSATHGASSAPAKQVLVEKQLKQGQTVILLFWNPSSFDDVAVRGQLQRLQALHKASGRPQNKNIAVHEARANEVAQFGSITRSLQINQTPTMLIISPGGNTKMLTGLADVYTIQQAISEARHS